MVQGKEKTTVGLAFSWLGSHVIGVVLCLILNFSFGTLIDNVWFHVGVGIFTFLIYAMIISAPSWDLGNRDRNRVKFGHRTEFLGRGFVMGFVVSIPLILFGIALLLAKAELLPNFYVIYKLVNAHVLPFINLIDGTSFGVQAAYLTEVSWGSMIGVFLLNFIIPIITGVQYILGYRDLQLMNRLIYKKDKQTSGVTK